ncbi:MAG: diaminopimelate epimerase [Lachnospiraceae bacterium]|nr:diaminopimelate epimerase [Lachnospiraceae bacterium]
MKFTKMHGIGNDYVYVDCVTTPWEQITDKTPEEVAIQVSDRHFGIGSDGLILIKTSEVADFFMDMYNLDGSRGSMCGNGIRSVAKYVYDHKLTDKTIITIETLAGIKTIDVTVEDDKAVLLKVDMGAPVLTSNEQEIPLWDGEQILMGEAADVAQLPVWEELKVSDADGWNDTMPETVETIGISMGNPHTIMFFEDMSQAPVLTLGPVMEKMSRFANRTNVEFIVVHDRQHLEMRVWERGSGETMACGTGACASAIAAMLAGFVDTTVTVSLLGGDLQIHWNQENGEVEMTGPATEVFSGEILL